MMVVLYRASWACGNSQLNILRKKMKTWMCMVCGLIYDEAEGWPDDGIVAGTRWEDVPADWTCPECGVGKADFEMVVF